MCRFGNVRFSSDIFRALRYLFNIKPTVSKLQKCNTSIIILGAYFYGMTSKGLNVLDHMYMAEVVAMILVTAMTIQVKFLISIF